MDVYQVIPAGIYSFLVKRELRSRLCFWRCISTQRLLPFENPRGYRETRSKCKADGAGRGYIAAPTHVIPGRRAAGKYVAQIKRNGA
jgi:hypothetical protein